MTGCEIIKCPDYKNKRCGNLLDYVNKDTGEDMCPRNDNAIPKVDYKSAQGFIDGMKEGSMKIDFESFLMEKHAEDYVGTDDMMPDAFADWVQDLGEDDVIRYGNLYAEQILTNLKG